MSQPAPPTAAFELVTAKEPFDASDLIGRCFGAGVSALLFEEGALPPSFFDLSTGVAGDFVQKLTNYRIRMAAVVPDVEARSRSFQDFAREANEGRQLRFVATMDEAREWLVGG